ncbi:flippase-like domain-containing protein [Dehalococcoidia bacterium]|nr:flippase-like domain-containing protein [Dehalococcoidia bacterium]
MLADLRFWVGITTSTVLVVLFLFTVNFREMLGALGDANYWYLVPAVGLYLASVWFRALRWGVLLRHLKPITTRRLYPVVVVGYMANNLLPMRLGEFVRSYYVGDREGISKTSALATIIVERICDALVLLLFIGVITLFVPLSGLARSFGDQSGLPWPGLVTVVSVPFIGAFVAGMILAAYPATAIDLVGRLMRPLPRRYGIGATEILGRLLQGLAPLRDLGLLSVLFTLTLPIWLAEAAVFYVLGFPFGLDEAHENLGTTAVTMVLVTAIANIGSSVPAAPGGLGLFEIIARETLVLGPLAAVDRPVAAGYALVVHATLMLPMIVLGQVILWADNISLGRLSRQGVKGIGVSSDPGEGAGQGT